MSTRRVNLPSTLEECGWTAPPRGAYANPMDGQPHHARQGPPELALYYVLVGLYFFAFGMQFVLFPSLVAFVLNASSEGVGLAQTALTGPMFCLLLFGGLLAERARPGPTLALLHLVLALASLALSAIVSAGWLSYTLLIAYAVLAGSCAAFVMPLRDAALNGVIARETARGRPTPMATAAATTTAVQIGAQIAGILAARLAGASPGPYLAVQALALAIGAAFALTLRAPKPTERGHSFSNALEDVRDGVRYAFSNKIMSPMLISAAYVGIFMVGAFQVLFPLIVREAYGGDAAAQAGRLGALLASFWGASFIMAAALSRLKPLRRPGRALIAAHLFSAVTLATCAAHLPFAALGCVVVAWGLAAGVAISTSRTIVQSAADERYLGRVLAVYSMGFMGGAPIGSALVGYAAGELGARTAALFPAICLGVAALALAMLTPLWRFVSDAPALSSDG